MQKWFAWSSGRKIWQSLSITFKCCCLCWLVYLVLQNGQKYLLKYFVSLSFFPHRRIFFDGSACNWKWKQTVVVTDLITDFARQGNCLKQNSLQRLYAVTMLFFRKRSTKMNSGYSAVFWLFFWFPVTSII